MLVTKGSLVQIWLGVGNFVIFLVFHFGGGCHASFPQKPVVNIDIYFYFYFQVCTKLGPLVAFESILSVHGDEVSMLNDMIVVVEDLRNVEFNLILVDKKSKFKLKKNNSQAKSSPAVPMLEYHSFPLPRITGSRSSLKVHNGLTLILKENSWIYFFTKYLCLQ